MLEVALLPQLHYHSQRLPNSVHRSPTIHERIIQRFSSVDISWYAFNSIYENNIQTLPVFGLNIFQSRAKNDNNKKKLDRSFLTLMTICVCFRFMLSSLVNCDNHNWISSSNLCMESSCLAYYPQISWYSSVWQTNMKRTAHFQLSEKDSKFKTLYVTHRIIL